MEGCRSKIHIPCERGPHKDNKNHKIFQICREKFLRNFRENLDRVPPCPSAWHKWWKLMWKILMRHLFSPQLHLGLFNGDLFLEQVKLPLKLLKSSVISQSKSMSLNRALKNKCFSNRTLLLAITFSKNAIYIFFLKNCRLQNHFWYEKCNWIDEW